MSGTAGVGTLFANAVTATGAQLDANYGTIVAFLNDPTNRNNYAADGAATNTVNLTFSPEVSGGYTAGLELTWKWGQTNTGPTVLNANGIGNANLVNIDGSALQSGQGVQGSIGKAVYDGTRFVYLNSFGTPASAAQVSAAASLVTFVSPGRVNNHPGVAKASAQFSGTATGTVTAVYGHNVTRIVRLGVGTYSVVITTAFANATQWIPLAISSATTRVASQDATSCVIVTLDSAGAAANSALVSFAAFGPQ